MGILSAMVNALRKFYPELRISEEEINITVTRLLAKIRTMAAMSLQDIPGAYRGLSPAGSGLLREFFEHDVRYTGKAL